MQTIVPDFRYALRTARRAPGFTAIAILTLALGIGSATAIFTLVDGVVLKPLSYRDPGQLVFLHEAAPRFEHIYPVMPVNHQHYLYWKQHANSFQSLAAFHADSATLTGAGIPERIEGLHATGSLFELLGIHPYAGRLLIPADDQPGTKVIVITDALWSRLYNRDPRILGQTMRLDNVLFRVIGILPPDFHFPTGDDLGILAGLGKRIDYAIPLGDPWPGWEGDYDYQVFGRLRPGVSLTTALAEMNLLEVQIRNEHKLDRGLHAVIAPLADVITGPARTGLTVLLCAVCLLLLIVCVNIANLQLARSGARSREFAIRAAIGGSRRRLLQQTLIESALLSFIGGALGSAGAWAAVRAFVIYSPIHVPRLSEVRFDLPVLLFSMGVTLLCGIIFGTGPALRFAGTSPRATLHSASHTIAGDRSQLGIRNWLVGSEVALGTVLLMLAGLLTSSMWKLLHVDRGFTGENTIAIPFRHTENARLMTDALAALRAIPGVTSAAFISGLPLTGESMVNGIELEGSNQSALDPTTRAPILVNVRFISSDYFSSMGIPLVKGRPIEESDRDRKVAVVSERLAAKLWPGRDAVGRSLRTGSRVGDVQVIGVSRDVHNVKLDSDPTLIIYVPAVLRPNVTGDMVVRTPLTMSALLPEVRRRLWALDPSMPIPPARTIAQLVSEATAQRRFQMQIASGFAVSALILAALGIYGVTMFNAARRRREIGIRLALGARPAEVRALMIANGLTPVILGLLAGLSAALALGRLIRSLLYQVSATDPATIAGVTGALLLISLIATAMPARQASALDPAKVLREE